MTNILKIRENLMRVYKNYEYIIQIAAKFILALLAFNYLNTELGYFETLTGLIPTLFLAVICAVVPVSVFVLIFAIVILLHLFKLSMMLAVIGAVVFLLFYFIYLRFAPEHGILIILYPVLSQFNLQYMLPLIGAMSFNPFAAVPIAFAVIFMKMITYIQEAAGLGLKSEDMKGVMESYQYVFDKLFSDKEIVAYIIVFTVVILVVYGISRLSWDYSWYMAVLVGSLINIIGLAFQASSIENVSIAMIVIGSILGGLLAMAGIFMGGVLDYSRRESLQFEDDDYYYYVKAIPKMKTEESEDTHKEIKKKKTKQKVEKPLEHAHSEQKIEKKSERSSSRTEEKPSDEFFEDIEFEEFDFDDDQN